MACPVLMDSPENQEKRASDTLAVPDVQDQLVKTDYLVNQEMLVPLDPVVHVVFQDCKENQEKKDEEVDLVLTVSQEKRENPEVPVSVPPVWMVQLENPVKEVHLVSQDLREKSDTQERTDSVKRVNPVTLVEMVRMAYPANVVSLVPQEVLDSMVKTDYQDPLENPDVSEETDHVDQKVSLDLRVKLVWMADQVLMVHQAEMVLSVMLVQEDTRVNVVQRVNQHRPPTQ